MKIKNNLLSLCLIIFVYLISNCLSLPNDDYKSITILINSNQNLNTINILNDIDIISSSIIKTNILFNNANGDNTLIVFQDLLNNITIQNENGTLYQQELIFNYQLDAYELENSNQDSNVIIFYKTLQQILSNVNPFLLSNQVQPIYVSILIKSNDIDEQYAIINQFNQYPIYLNGTKNNGYFYESILNVFSNEIIKSLKSSIYNQLNFDEIYKRDLNLNQDDKSTAFIKGFIDFLTIILKKISITKLSNNDSINSILDDRLYYINIKHYIGPKNFVSYSSSSIASSLLDLYDGTIEKSTISLNSNKSSTTITTSSSTNNSNSIIQLESNVSISKLINSFKNDQVYDIESFSKVLVYENQDFASTIEQVMFSSRFIRDCIYVDCNNTISINLSTVNDPSKTTTTNSNHKMLKSIIQDNTGWSNNGTLGRCIFYDSSNHQYYNLQPLILSSGAYYTAKFANTEPSGGTNVGYDIRFNLCGSEGSNVCGTSDAMACQIVKDQYIPVGLLSQPHSIHDGVSYTFDDFARMTLTYQTKVDTTSCSANGNRRTFSIHLACSYDDDIVISSTDNSEKLCAYHVTVGTKYMCKHQPKLFDSNTGFLYDFTPLYKDFPSSAPFVISDGSYDILYNLFGYTGSCILGDGTWGTVCRRQVGNISVSPGDPARYTGYTLILGGGDYRPTFTDNGVTLVYSYLISSTGTECVGNGRSWSITFIFECDQTIEYEAGGFSYSGVCNYNVPVKTKYACPTSRFLDNQQLYDFSGLQLKQSSYYKAPLEDGSSIYFNLNQKFDQCKTLIDKTGSGYPSMKHYSACQIYGDGRAFPIAATNGEQIIKHTYNSISIQHNTPGQVLYCDSNNRRRTLNLNFQCDINRDYLLVSAGETSLCVYSIVIKTKFACESLVYFNRDKNNYIDLSSLRTTPSLHKVAPFQGYNIYYGIGEKVNYCSEYLGSVSGLDYQSCQTYNTIPVQTGGFITSTTTIWNSDGVTIEYYSTDGYPGCSVRKLRLQFICDMSTEFGQTTTSEAPACVYLIKILSKYACTSHEKPPTALQSYPVKSLTPPINNPNFENQLNGKFYDLSTGSFYDLSPLKRSHDNPYIIQAFSAQAVGFYLRFNLFGYTSLCSNNAQDWIQSCQIYKGAFYETGYLTIAESTVFSSNGLSITYTSSTFDTENCGSRKRKIKFEFTCNRNEEYKQLLATEPTICEYKVTIETKYACPIQGLLINVGSLYDLRPLMTLKSSDNPFSSSFTDPNPNPSEYDFYFNIYNSADICQVKANLVSTNIYACLVSKSGLDIVTTFTKPSITFIESSPRVIAITYSNSSNPASTYIVYLNCDSAKDFSIISSTKSLTQVKTKYACPTSRYFSNGGSLNSTQVIDLTPLQKSMADTPYSFTSGDNTVSFNIGNSASNCNGAQSCFGPSKTILGQLSSYQFIKQTSSGIQIRYYSSTSPISNSFYEDPLGDSRGSFTIDLVCNGAEEFKIIDSNLFAPGYTAGISAQSKHACLRSSQFVLPSNPNPCYRYCTPPAPTGQVDLTNILFSLSICLNEIDDYGSQYLATFFNDRWTPNSVSYDYTSGQIYKALFKGGDAMLSLLSKYVTITVSNQCTYSTKGLGKVSLNDFITVTNDLISLSNKATIKESSSGGITVYFYQTSTSTNTGLGIVKYNDKLCYFGETTTSNYKSYQFLSGCPFVMKCQFECSLNSKTALESVISQGKKDFSSTLLLLGSCLEQIQNYNYEELNHYLTNVWTPNPIDEDYTSGQFYKYLNQNSASNTIKTLSKYITSSIHQVPEGSNVPSYQCIYGEFTVQNSLNDILLVSNDIIKLTQSQNALKISYSASSSFETFFIPPTSSLNTGLSIVLFGTRICGFAESSIDQFESGSILDLCPFGPIIEDIINPTVSLPLPYQYSITIKGRKFEESIIKVAGIECTKNTNDIISNGDGTQTLTCTLLPYSSSIDYSLAPIEYYNSYSKDIKSFVSNLVKGYRFEYPTPLITSIVYQFDQNQPDRIPMYSKITIQGENFYPIGLDSQGIQIFIDDYDLTFTIQDKQQQTIIQSPSSSGTKDSLSITSNGYGESNQVSMFINGNKINIANGVQDRFNFSRPVISRLSKVDQVVIGETISIYGEGLNSLYLVVFFGLEKAQIKEIVSSSEIRVEVPTGYISARVTVSNDQLQSLEEVIINYIQPTIDLEILTSNPLNTHVQNSFILVGRGLGFGQEDDYNTIGISLTDYTGTVNPYCETDTYCDPELDYGTYVEPSDGLFDNDNICQYLQSKYQYFNSIYNILICDFSSSISKGFEITITNNNKDYTNEIGQVIKRIPYSYKEPSISKLSNYSLPTDGNSSVSIDGFNFIPMETYNIKLFSMLKEYTDKWLEESSIKIGDYDCLNNDDPSDLWIDSTFINCIIPPGIGSNHSVVVTVGGQTSLSETYFSYDPPVLDLENYPIQDARSDNFRLYSLDSSSKDDSSIIITGQNFIPSSLVDKYNNIDQDNENYIIIGENENNRCNQIEWIDSATVKCTPPPGIGVNHRIIIVVGNQESQEQDVYYSYNRPTLDTVNYSGETDGSSIITITGTNFIPKELAADYNNQENQDQENYILFGDYDNNRCNQIEWIDSTTVKCTPPPGIGINHRITIVVGNQESQEQDVYYSYNRPTLDTVNYSGETDGSSIITITGTNFIPKELAADYNNQENQDQDQENIIYIGEYNNYCESIEWVDSATVKCTPPPGIGINHRITIVVGNQESQESNVKFSFNKPTLDSFSYYGDTDGSSIITIIGTNFIPKELANDYNSQPDQDSLVTIDGNSCKTLEWVDYKSLKCGIPRGEGKNLDIKVTVDNQQISAQLFSYKPPFIDSITPMKGKVNTDNTINIQCTNYGLNPKVRVGSNECANVLTLSDSLLSCVTSSAKEGFETVVVTSKDQESNKDKQFEFYREDSSSQETDSPTPTPTPTPNPSTTTPSTTIPSTTIPSTTIPSTTIPSTTIPSTTIPATTIPATTIPATTIPATTIPATTIPATTIPATTIPATTIPATTIPATTIPATTIPATTIGSTTSSPGSDSTTGYNPGSTTSSPGSDSTTGNNPGSTTSNTGSDSTTGHNPGSTTSNPGSDSTTGNNPGSDSTTGNNPGSTTSTSTSTTTTTSSPGLTTGTLPTNTPIPSDSSSDDSEDFKLIITGLSSYSGNVGDVITIYGSFPNTYSDLFAYFGNELLIEGDGSLSYVSNTRLLATIPNGLSIIYIRVSFGYEYSNQVEFVYNPPTILHVDHQEFNTADVNRFFVFGINFGSFAERLVTPFIDHANGEKEKLYCEVEAQCNRPFKLIEPIKDSILHPCTDDITLANNQQYFNQFKYDKYVCILPSPNVGKGTIRFFNQDMVTVYEGYSFEYSFLPPQISFINDPIEFNSIVKESDIITIHGSQFPPTQEIFDKQLNETTTIEWNENENYVSIGPDYKCQDVQWINSTLAKCIIPPGTGEDLLVTVTAGSQTSNSLIYISYSVTPTETPTNTPTETPTNTPTDSSSDNSEPVITGLSSYSGNVGDVITIYGSFPNIYSTFFAHIGYRIISAGENGLTYVSNTQLSIMLPLGFSKINIMVSFQDEYSNEEYSNEVEFVYNPPTILHVDHQEFNTADVNRFFVFGINFGSFAERLVTPFIDHANGEKEKLYCEVEAQCNRPFKLIEPIKDDLDHPCTDDITLANNQQYFNQFKYDKYVCILPSPNVGKGTIRFFNQDMVTVYEGYSFEYSFLPPQISFINDPIEFNSIVQDYETIIIHGSQFPPTQEIFDKQLNETTTIEWNENENYVSIGPDYKCQDVQWINSTLVKCIIPPGTGEDLLVTVTAGSQTSNSLIYISYPDEYMLNPVISSLSSSIGSGGDIITIHGNFPKISNDKGSLLVHIGSSFLGSSKLTYISNTQVLATIPNGFSSVRLSVEFGSNPSNQVDFVYDPPTILHVDHQEFNTADVNRFFVFGINFGSFAERLVTPFIDHPNGEKEKLYCEVEAQCNHPFKLIEPIKDDLDHPCTDDITLANNQQYFNQFKYDKYVCILPSPNVGKGTIRFFNQDMVTVYEGYSFEYSFLPPQISFINDPIEFNSIVKESDIITIHGSQFPPTQEIFDKQLNETTTIEWNENENYVSIGPDYKCQDVQWINSTLVKCIIPPGTGEDLLVTVIVGSQSSIQDNYYVSYS